MSIELNSGIKLNAPVVLDERMIMTKEEMLDVNDELKYKIPDGFLIQCKDDGQIYVYHKDGVSDPNTGKFEQYVNKDLGSMVLNGIHLKKIEDYLYEISCSDLDYEWARKVFEENPPVSSFFGGCSSMRRGNFHGRNFDWKYDNAVEFIVKTEAAGGHNTRHATLGTACNIKGFNKDFVESRTWSVNYKAVPFLIVDGINDEGVCCNINIVPARKWTTVDPETGDIIECDGKITATVPTVSKNNRICSIMLPRFVLDNFSSAYLAAQYIQEHVEVFSCEFLNKINEEVHIMISDQYQSYVVEFLTIRNITQGTDPVCTSKIMQVFDIKDPSIKYAPVMTNFHIYGINPYNEDSELAELYTPFTQYPDKYTDHDAISWNRVEPYGAGVERYNILFNESKTDDDRYVDMFNSMNKTWYTNLYTKGKSEVIWYTELAGYDESAGIDLKVNTPTATLDPYYAIQKDAYEHRSRETGETWQTVHSCVFDIKYRVMYVTCQENINYEKEAYIFNFGDIYPEEIPVTVKTPTDWEDVFDGGWFTSSFSDFGMSSFNGSFYITDTSVHYDETNPFVYSLDLTTPDLDHIRFRILDEDVIAYLAVEGTGSYTSAVVPFIMHVSSYMDSENNKCIRLTFQLPMDDEQAKVKVIFNHTFMMSVF